jgi:diaminohydroxyphosphoribosylaminopyrimidine deaminase / 5-amino-6-(5-phosphoribosylamino)uracil reductase
MSDLSDFDIAIMAELLALARPKKGATGMNPTVAAGLVVDGRLIGTGVHDGDGHDHAECVLIKKMGNKCKDATLYVTLEPCTHQGKTPPCVDAIVKAGFAKVVYAIEDINPDVRARSARSVLEDAGIVVETGVLEDEARELNEVFFHIHKKKRPFVTVKVAQSLDRKMTLAGNKTGFLTSKESRKDVHWHRRQADAIVVGVGTIVADDPALNIRYDLLVDGFKNPKKIIIDPSGRTPLDARIFSENDDTEVMIVVDEDLCDSEAVEALAKKAQIMGFQRQQGRFDLAELGEFLLAQGVHHLYVEGGAKTIRAFLDSGFVDKVMIYEAQVIVGKSNVVSPFDLAGWVSKKTLGGDKLYLTNSL